MKRPRYRNGFTLIEAIIAIVILSVAVPPMLWSIRQGHLLRVDPVMTSRARWLAAEKLEDIIADRHSSTRGWSYVTGSNYPAESSVSGFAGFSRSVSITEVGPGMTPGGTGYKFVAVSVSWVDVRGTPRTLALSTVVTDY